MRVLINIKTWLIFVIGFMTLSTPIFSQYYDLSVGIERYFYNCIGYTSVCVALSGENYVGLERVDDEVVIDGVTWSVVTWMLWRDWLDRGETYFIADNALITQHLYRIEDSLLLEYIDGQEIPIFDFEIAHGDTLANHFEPYTSTVFQGRTPYNAVYSDMKSVILADTTIVFPDNQTRRILWGENPDLALNDIEPDQYADFFVNEVLHESNGTLVPRYDLDYERYQPYYPYYYVEGIGVLITPVNHRGYIMGGYKYPGGSRTGWSLPLPTSIESNDRPTNITLHPNYPNPFNPSTVIGYELPESAQVRLSVYDLLGREVAVLVNEITPAGQYQAVFNGQNLSSGIYVYRLQSGGQLLTGKMLLMK